MNTVEFDPLRQTVPGDFHRCDEPGDLDSARRIEASIVYMARHLNEPLPASVLAAQVNISTSHFFTLFKRAGMVGDGHFAYGKTIFDEPG